MFVHVLADKHCGQGLVLTQRHAHVFGRPDAAARSLSASRDLALAVMASLSWLLEVDVASVVPRLPILRARARNADGSTSGEREATRRRQVLVARTCRQVLADNYLCATTCARATTCTSTYTSTCRQVLADT
jgi:hypothetical protein